MESTADQNELRAALESQAGSYGLTLTSEACDGLVKYFEILIKWNARLHLVAPCSPRDFATRHLLESLLLVKFLPTGAQVADVGSGAGLPILPCLIAREDIKAVMIEASKKKAVFLREALIHTHTVSRASLVAERFENTPAPDVDFVTCRALERFGDMLPGLVEWAPSATFLLFGGSALEHSLKKLGLEVETNLIPHSEKRFLFVARKAGR